MTPPLYVSDAIREVARNAYVDLSSQQLSKIDRHLKDNLFIDTRTGSTFVWYDLDMIPLPKYIYIQVTRLGKTTL